MASSIPRMFAVIWLLIGVYNVESVRNVECDKATKKDFQSSEYIMFRIPVTCAPVAFPGYMCAFCLPCRGPMLAAWAQPGAMPNATNSTTDSNSALVDS